MYCSNCGKKLSPDDYFCSNCGTPVLRQGLFDDDDSDAHEDAFEETRLFTAEELGQYLNDDEELAKAHEASRKPLMPRRRPPSRKKPPLRSQPIKPSPPPRLPPPRWWAQPAPLPGKFKAGLGAMKAKQSEKKQAQEAARAEKAAQQTSYEAPEEDPVSAYIAEEEVAQKKVSRQSDEPVSMKKIVLPVIVARPHHRPRHRPRRHPAMEQRRRRHSRSNRRSHHRHRDDGGMIKLPRPERTQAVRQSVVFSSSSPAENL